MSYAMPPPRPAQIGRFLDGCRAWGNGKSSFGAFHYVSGASTPLAWDTGRAPLHDAAQLRLRLPLTHEALAHYCEDQPQNFIPGLPQRIRNLPTRPHGSPWFAAQESAATDNAHFRSLVYHRPFPGTFSSWHLQRHVGRHGRLSGGECDRLGDQSRRSEDVYCFATKANIGWKGSTGELTQAVALDWDASLLYGGHTFVWQGFDVVTQLARQLTGYSFTNVCDLVGTLGRYLMRTHQCTTSDAMRVQQLSQENVYDFATATSAVVHHHRSRLLRNVRGKPLDSVVPEFEIDAGVWPSGFGRIRVQIKRARTAHAPLQSEIVDRWWDPLWNRIREERVLQRNRAPRSLADVQRGDMVHLYSAHWPRAVSGIVASTTPHTVHILFGHEGADAAPHHEMIVEVPKHDSTVKIGGETIRVYVGQGYF